MTSAVFKALEEDNFELNTQKNNYLRGIIQIFLNQLFNHFKNMHFFCITCTEPLTENIQINYKGKLTERLLAQGLLTPSMLQELHHEWTQVKYKIKIDLYNFY